MAKHRTLKSVLKNLYKVRLTLSLASLHVHVYVTTEWLQLTPVYTETVSSRSQPAGNYNYYMYLVQTHNIKVLCTKSTHH